ncbi:hypothetical protein HUJ04_001286 [Dendroctonus ponderosae]|nr:hypothetical protein HUJ04_001286 [Dendroctonus ponderosae]KAH1012041.1 hypothetical protein HUJ04_001286 [Dendroctonus ponderosae]
MDKYTVDLDQVLNDFEYSELTDQQAKSVPDRPQHAVPLQPVVKHSINNVFHSLNEYINSGISSATLLVESPDEPGPSDNNVDFNNIHLEEHPISVEDVPASKAEDQLDEAEAPAEELDVNRSEADRTHQETQLVLLEDVDESSLEPVQTTQPIAGVADDSDPSAVYCRKTENVVKLLGLEDSPKPTPSSINDNLECDINVNEKADNSLDNNTSCNGDKEIDDLSPEDSTDQKEDGHSEDLLVKIDEAESFQSTTTDKFEHFVIEPAKSPYALGIADVQQTESSTPGIELEGVTVQEEETAVVHSEEASEDVEIEPAAEEGRATVQGSDEDVEVPCNPEVELEENCAKSEPSELPTASVEPEVAAKIASFSADLEIDENELNKMLEDLELEEQEDAEERVEELPVVDTIDQRQISEQSAGVSTLVTSEDAEVVPLADDLESDPAVEEPLAKENQPPMECLEMERPKKSKTSKVEKLEQEARKEPDEEPPAIRPQNLPLNNQAKEEHVERKIDLIGMGPDKYHRQQECSPGSTPYNNVYINKSIEPKGTHDNEFDYTSSASPTFSDCSADSTSTASTVSIEDATNTAKNPAGIKNTNADQQPVDAGDKQDQQPVATGATKSEESSSEGAERVTSTTLDGSRDSETFAGLSGDSQLGKAAPLWIPDADAASCLHCDMKFTVIKRRHHCRACGLVLCSKCCGLKFRLEYLDAEARVCNKCHDILNKDAANSAGPESNPAESAQSFRPNPNNPLEYCSTVSPLQQAGQDGAPPPSVMVPVGVLKRKGSDLTILDQDFNYNSASKTPKPAEKAEQPKKTEEKIAPPVALPTPKISRNLPKIDDNLVYSDCSNTQSVVEVLKTDVLTFAINQNLFVRVRVINMSCCINKYAWCFCSEGLINVGCDEVVYLIEYIDEESFVPKDVFFHIQNVYLDAVKGTAVNELGISLHNTFNFLDSRNHAGFVYIKPSFQCLENVLVPNEPYLIGILIHRWETPWAKLFPLRLILRLGADYRYYPSPLISTRHRDSVFVEIGHTIINLLADFRNFTYTLPQIRGLYIHMEGKKTTITIPKNRYDLVIKSINNTSEHILAFAGNFSPAADSHLVCIQDTQGPQNNYSTHAINIHNMPRKVTGASFIVFNGSLKSSSGLTAKSNIVEDGLMIQIRPESMEKIRDDLRKLKNHTVSCGLVNATNSDDIETVNIVWGENDCDFNVGVKSPVDLADMHGVPSIRVHNGKDYFCSNGSRLIRWTEVFILQSDEENPRNQDPVDVSKVSESVSKACCTALLKYLDLLVANNCQKIGVRATLHVENVSYSAGSNGVKLAPIYMRSLDNELIPVLHGITSNNLGNNAIVLELIFRILNA